MTISTVASIVKAALPHGYVQHRIKQKALERRRAALPMVSNGHAAYGYKAAIEFLVSRGLPRGHVVSGSMPRDSLYFCFQMLDERLTGDAPLTGLHVGNFLGVSLSFFASYASKVNSASVILSVDPNLTHRGIERPQEHVLALLNHFGLQKNVMISVGYSAAKSISNDGVTFAGESGEYDPHERHAAEVACENTLANLALLSPGRFDFAVMDGNHDASYLRRETEIVRTLLKPDGLLILDDVDDNWTDIKAEFAAMGSHGWRAMGMSVMGESPPYG